MKNLSRANSICPSPEDLLLDYVKKNDYSNIQKIIKEEPRLLKHVYGFPYDKKILEIACCEENIDPQTVETLINLGADLEGNTEWTPLYLAATNPNAAILETVALAITRSRNPQDINGTINGNTALHTILKNIEIEDEGKFLRHVEILLKAGIDVNRADGKNFSAILWAAKKGFKQVVGCLLKETSFVDLDSHSLRGKTARDLILQQNLYPEKDLPEKSSGKPADKSSLFSHVKQSKETDFLRDFAILNQSQGENLVDSDDGSMTLLQYACQKNLPEIVRVLLDNGADFTKKHKNDDDTPYEIVAKNGHFKISPLLLAKLSQVAPEILCFLIKHYDSSEFLDAGISHKICLQDLLDKVEAQKVKVDINGSDLLATPLHYALKYADKEISSKLLKLGASLAQKNYQGDLVVADMKPELLEEYLDSFIQFDPKNKNPESSEYAVVFNYKNLLPVGRNYSKEKEDLEGQAMDENIMPECDVVFHMSKSSHLKHLLKHPVIVGFLFMKWHRMRWLFYTNLFFYILFIVSLMTYIFTVYTQFSSTPNESWANLSYVVLTILFVFFICRELFQFSLSPREYVKNFENWIEFLLIICSAMIIFIKSPTEDVRRQLSSFSILLSAFELILMVGQHPKLSTNIVMLQTVSVNFFKLLLWYSLLIIAFAFSFNILFSHSHQEGKNGTETEDNEMFSGPGKSIFKTIVMVTGEFDASSINFETYPLTSKFIFALFVFMITIILLNLLNGLAVSDTQAIKNEAELVGHISRAKHIKDLESMFFFRNIFSGVTDLFCCIPKNELDLKIFNPLIRRFSLFPPASDKQLTVMPNKYGKILVNQHSKKRNEENYECLVTGCTEMYLDKDSLQRTKNVINNRLEKDHNVIEREMIIAMKNQLDNLMNKLLLEGKKSTTSS